MTWQDLVFTIGQALFAAALVPAIASPSKPPRSTCLLTSGVLAIYALTFATMAFWWSSITSLTCSAFWLVLAIQRRAVES